MRTATDAAPNLPVTTEIERRAIDWIRPYSQAWHLERARDWLVYLDPAAPLEARLAVMTHDIERMFPNGPQLDKSSGRWDDPHYLYAHAAPGRGGRRILGARAGRCRRRNSRCLRSSG